MSGGQTPPTQTTTNVLSPEQQQLYQTVLPSIQQFAASPPPQRFPGSTVAGFTPTQETGQSQLLQGAGTTGDIADWSRSGVTGLPGTLSGTVAGTTPFVGSSDVFGDPGVWNPNYNTGLQSAIEAAQRPTWQALTEQALPAIRTGALSAGPAGSSRQGIAEGLATGRAAQSANDQAARIVEDLYNANLAAQGQRYGQNVGAETARYGTDIGAANTRYGQNVNALLAAYGMAPSLQQQALVPGATTSAVGDVQQQLKQAMLTGDVNAWNYDQMAPWLKTQELLSVLQALPGGSTVSTGNVPQPNAGLMALGGAGTGAAIGSALFPGVGTAAGAGIGATLPFLFR